MKTGEVINDRKNQFNNNFGLNTYQKNMSILSDYSTSPVYVLSPFLQIGGSMEEKYPFFEPQEEPVPVYFSFIVGFIVFLIILTVIALNANSAEAQVIQPADIQIEKLADSIKLAENSKTKPYGIMKDYCTAKTESQCRKGCIQTIEHALKDWDGEGDFIQFLGNRYAPISAHPLNKNWVKNVRSIYARLAGE